MIEVNLLSDSLKSSPLVVAGVDLRLLNPKGVVLALVLLYVPEIFIESHYEDARAETSQAVQVLTSQRQELSGKLKELEVIEKQIDVLKEQEERLQGRLNVIKGIVDAKNNPFPILKYVAENTPEDLWIDELEITDTKELLIAGGAQAYKSIGVFIDNLKNSIFFGPEIEYSQPDEAGEEQVRFEKFKVKAKVVRFN